MAETEWELRSFSLQYLPLLPHLNDQQFILLLVDLLLVLELCKLGVREDLYHAVILITEGCQVTQGLNPIQVEPVGQCLRLAALQLSLWDGNLGSEAPHVFAILRLLTGLCQKEDALYITESQNMTLCRWTTQGDITVQTVTKTHPEIV